ncbi:MAG: glycosyltransferase family protein [Bacteroidota bacterium]|nr:glycosyltransferase family protein [Bacteroidota bacterium]
MKILYAIQGTGNGHLARATEIVPLLKSMADTDVLVSGTQSELKVPFQIDYHFSGMSFIVGQNGGIDLLKTIQRMPVKKFLRDIKSLPVKQYDLVISDFEPVSAWACQLRKKTCVGLSHQNAVLHTSAPRPEYNDLIGKLILKKYAPATFSYGFNFKASPSDVFPPVIRPAIRNADATVKPHYTVYLPAYGDQQIQDVLIKIPEIEWEVFSRHLKVEYRVENVHFQPVSLDVYAESFQSCTGLICNAGFEGPAEALFLGKKLCVIPMKGQYEQHCNAAYLKSMGIKVLDHFTNSETELAEWIHNSTSLQIKFPDLTCEILDTILKKHGSC